MQVKLKVIGGKNDGREIRLNIPEFVIGRGDEAHLRPNSDLISRQHCSIKVDNGRVIIADLGSRNGTFVNGRQLEGPHEAKPGDLLRVGRLQFEMVIDHVQPGAKKPKVEGVAEAAARTASAAGGEGFDEESITDWLSAPQDAEDSTQALADTQQFRLDETPTKLFVRSDEMNRSKSSDTAEFEAPEEEPPSGTMKKKKPGRLPNRPKFSAESSKVAADEVLRKFFNRR